MIDLQEKKCVPCEAGTLPFDQEQIKEHKNKLSPEWKVIEDKKLRKEYPFENFKRGMAFAQEIGIIAEEEGHHPDICIHYTNVEVELSTHAINGLSENDFIMAAKIDNI